MLTIIGVLLILAGSILFLLPIVLSFTIKDQNLVQGYMFWLWALSGGLIYLGRRLCADPAEQVLEEDSRDPILYLRSFRRDMADSIRMLFALIFRNRDLGGRTREEELVRELREKGPVIAVGKPGEQLPPIGAARHYLSSEGDDWKREVTELMKRSQSVVIRGSGTQGLLWEIQEVLRAIEPQKLMLVFDHRWDYECFYEWAWPLFPKGLPNSFPGAELRFADGWLPLPGDVSQKKEAVLDISGESQSGVPSPTLAARWSPLPPPVQITAGLIDLCLIIALSFFVTSFSRAQITGWGFAAFSVITIAVVCYLVEIIVIKLMDRIAPGDILMGQLPRLSASLLRTAIITYHSFSYSVDAHFRPLIERATKIEKKALERKQAAGDRAASNLESCINTRTGETLLDILKADAFGFRATLRSLGLQQFMIIRLASIIFPGIACLSLSVSTGQIDEWISAVVMLGIGIVSGSATTVWAGRGRFTAFFQHPVFEDANDPDREFLEQLSNKPVRVRSHAGPGFSIGAGIRIAKWSSPTLGLYLVFLPVIFLIAAFLTMLWPGAASGWSVSYWYALLFTTIGCGLFVLSSFLTAVTLGKALVGEVRTN